MKILSRLFLIASVIFSGITPVDLASEPQKTVKIEIVHSHEHDEHHHDHHHDEKSADLDSHEKSVALDSDSSSPCETSKKHSHEILISFGQSIFIESKPEYEVEFNMGIPHPDPQNLLLPRQRALSSIFRPPILV